MHDKGRLKYLPIYGYINPISLIFNFIYVRVIQNVEQIRSLCNIIWDQNQLS